jgi:penicillin-binding protein 1B
MAAGRGSGASRARRRSRRARGATGARRRSRTGLRPQRAAAIALAILAFGAGIYAGRTVVRLDRIVRARFEGQLFRIPSRVYAAPIILYPGLDVERAGLRAALARQGYREEASARVDQPGGFHWEAGRVWIHVRAFDHPARPQPARPIELRLRGSHIESIRDRATGHELAAVPLDPELVGAYYGADREQRELVRIEELPPHLVDAVLAVEDRRFERHRGIDWRRVAGAMWANVRAGDIRQGGSTLTQQLVKNFFLTPERTLSRKLHEAVMALLVEARYEKEAILEAYLNEIYLGQRGPTGIHGIGEAARYYFGKPASTLDVAESALLAGLIQSPNAISPYRHPDRARARRDLVLDLMRQQGRLGEAEYEAAVAEPLALAPPTVEPRESRYFLDALRRELPSAYDHELLTSGGLTIHSTLDLRLQQLATEALRQELAALEKAHPALRPSGGQRLQGCVIALRPQTGEVLALVGGRSYGESQFDRCTQARRPAGSAFKPFVYLAALEAGGGTPAITLASFLEDTPLTLETPAGPWQPANYDHEFHGRVPVREALERSFNVATARLGQQVGIERVVDMAHRLGITSPLPPVPSLALGAADLSPLELARAYATIANGGVRPEVRTFEDLVDANGEVRERRAIAFERVLDPATSFLGVSLLAGVVDRGTGRALRSGGLTGPVVGKTGTSDDSNDAWFAGFTPELVVVVWVGFDEPRGMKLPASRLALPVWLHFVREATGGDIRGDFAPPPGVVVADVDPETGALALARCPRRRPEYFLEGTEPTDTCPAGGIFVREREGEPGEPASPIERWFDRWIRGLL